MMIKLNGYLFWLKMMAYWRNMILFGIKSLLILKKVFDNEPVYNKKSLKTKIKSYNDEATDFLDK